MLNHVPKGIKHERQKLYFPFLKHFWKPAWLVRAGRRGTKCAGLVHLEHWFRQESYHWNLTIEALSGALRMLWGDPTNPYRVSARDLLTRMDPYASQSCTLWKGKFQLIVFSIDSFETWIANWYTLNMAKQQRTNRCVSLLRGTQSCDLFHRNRVGSKYRSHCYRDDHHLTVVGVYVDGCKSRVMNSIEFWKFASRVEFCVAQRTYLTCAEPGRFYTA